ncbi:MAG: mannosyltransferase family protein [Dehalococcoidales bacterium]|nr:mannosyltransferase family protein [Dehalococcoidales bacterium]
MRHIVGSQLDAYRRSGLARAVAGVRAHTGTLAGVLTVFLAVKVGFYLVGVFAATTIPEYMSLGLPPWTTGAPVPIDISWRWDSGWYLDIILHGYRITDPTYANYNNVAFFPLYPVLIIATNVIVGGRNIPLAGVLVASLAYLGGLFFVYKLALLDGSRAMAQRAIWFLAIFPAAFFFNAAYSEPLFLLTAAGSLYYLRLHRWWLAGLFGMLAALTRTQGVLLALPFAWELLATWRREGHIPWRYLPSALLPLLGLEIFMGYLLWQVGDALAFVHAQNGWARSFALPWDTIWRALVVAATGVHDARYFWSLVNTASVLTFLGVALVSLRRWPAVYSLYVFASITVALTSPSGSGPTESAARFMAVLFPVFLTLAAWTERRPWLDRLITAVSLPMFGLLTALFVNWFWVV